MTADLSPPDADDNARLVELLERHDVAVRLSRLTGTVEVSFFADRFIPVTNPQFVLEQLEATDLKTYRPVPGYIAAVDLVADVIDAVFVSGPQTPWLNAGPNLMAIGPVTHERFPGQSIEIRESPPVLTMLSRFFAFYGPPSNVLTLRGFNATSPNRARDVLDDIAASFLYEIALVHGCSLALERVIPRTREPDLPRHDLPSLKIHPPTFPLHRYDREPMTLYGYALDAESMPLLQFLALYQVLEYYFPRYAEAEVRHRVQQILKDARFNAHDPRDIGRLLHAANAKDGERRSGNEREKLRATLRTCVAVPEIEEFLASDDIRTAFAQRKHVLGLPPINTKDRERDLRDAVADRVYALRCKIVHTKEDDGPVELLLPNSPEAHQLSDEIGLVRLLAERVISASCREAQPR